MPLPDFASAATPGGFPAEESGVGGPYDVAIIGGGVIGLSIAWRAARRGMSVGVFDPAPGSGASRAAAGMLAPVTEAHWGEEAHLEPALHSAKAWAGFAAELEEASGLPVGYRPCGTLVVGADGGDRRYLEELFRFGEHLGLELSWCTPTACRELEPLLAPGVRGGILAAGDHQVDNRLLLAALLEACRRGGVEIVRRRVDAVASAGGRVSGLRVDEHGGEVKAGTVVLAAGAWSPAIGGLPADCTPPVRPVKGQILRLRPMSAGPALARNVRLLVEGRSRYLVPRADGRVVLGSTVEEMGFDERVTAAAVHELLRDAARMLPFVLELELEEAMAGLRPGTPDNAPLVGAGGLDGLLIATGHYRNGILLTPVTAAIVEALLSGDEPPAIAAGYSPARLADSLVGT